MLSFCFGGYGSRWCSLEGAAGGRYVRVSQDHLNGFLPHPESLNLTPTPQPTVYHPSNTRDQPGLSGDGVHREYSTPPT